MPKMTTDQELVVNSYLNCADVEALHRLCEMPAFPPYFGSKAINANPGGNVDYVAAAQSWLANLGVSNFALREEESEAKQLHRIVRQLYHGARRRLAEFEQPFQQMVGEIRCERAAKEHAAARNEFRQKYGTKCSFCQTTRTKMVHPFLDVLCCNACQWSKGPQRLIYRTTARKVFHLSDEQLESLKYIEVVNQHYKSGPPARLYLRSAVQQLSDSVAT
jgi:hypothetical protein